MTDERIIAAVLNGERQRFADLVRRHQRVLMQYLWNLILDQHDCEELAQEAFLRAFDKLPRFDQGQSSFRTWLLVIARNLAFNYLAKLRPQVVAELPEPTNTPDPGENIQRQEWFDELNRALAELPLEQRSAFVLAEIQELSYAEVSAIEQVPVGTIKSRVSRAKQQLRNRLAPDVTSE